jgi:hypothetical protein
MRHPIRTVSIAVMLAAAAAANAQSNPLDQKSHGASTQSALFGKPVGRTITNPIAGATPLRVDVTGQAGQVTPVPEPSEWAMMLAGLAVVGFIVSRNSKRS